MRLIFAPLIGFAFAAVSHAACGSKTPSPSDNAVATLYGASAYPWAASVNWNCTYNIADYPGSSADARFAAAQADAVKGGGGVVYFPAGTYSFASNISLASNVLIRGAPVGSQQAKNGKLPGNLMPTTVFSCPNRMHQGLWNFDPDATNLGIVNVLMDQCAIMLWPSLKTTSYSPMLSNWWFSASDINGMGSNKIVLGNYVRDVSLGQSLLAPSTGNVYPYIFSIAVGVYSDRNALVANNLIAASQRSEQTTITLQGDKMTVPYMYDNRYGIDVNLILLGAVASAYANGPKSKCGTPNAFGGLYPACAPWNFRPGLVIRDNWVAQNGRVGISFTGGTDAEICAPGNGTVVYNNHVEVKAGTTCYTVTGQTKTSGSDTNENRGYLLSGYCNNVTSNTGHINRQLASDTGYETVDGEGILHQSQNGNPGYGDFIAHNDLSGGSSGYIANWDLPSQNYTTLIGNTVNSDQFIGVVLMNADTIGAGWHCSGNTPAATFQSNGKTTPCPP